MSCCSGKEKHKTSCCGSSIDPALWSTKKKISILEECLDCVTEKGNEIKKLINEHKEELK
ncbi:MAG: hypothetical protein GY760_27085 [Deltaproteobacteria bacterium]|nr:hypothetical protein [Deltaproteobacteria bacterium]